MNELTATSAEVQRIARESARPAPSAEQVREWLFSYLRDKHHVALEKLDLKDDATSIGLDSLQMEQLLGDLEVWLDVTVDVAAVVRCENLGELLHYFETLPGSAPRYPGLRNANQPAESPSTGAE
jgi:acyl carrier protein